MKKPTNCINLYRQKKKPNTLKWQKKPKRSIIKIRGNAVMISFILIKININVSFLENQIRIFSKRIKQILKKLKIEYLKGHVLHFVIIIHQK